MFSLNVKDHNICLCLHNIRLAYNIYKCFSALSIRMCMSTSNSQHDKFSFDKTNEKYLPKKGRALMQMYRVVPQTKGVNYYIPRSNMLVSHLCSTARPRSAIHVVPSLFTRMFLDLISLWAIAGFPRFPSISVIHK